MNNSVEKYDAAIIGAGPAGSMAADLLASNGLRVILIEKESLPRYKTCGGGIIYKALKLIPFDISECVESVCYKAEVNDCNNNLRFSVERKLPIITMVMRNSFDYLLVRKAVESGAVLRDGAEVTDLNVIKDGIDVKTGRDKLIAGYVIAADGANGFISKKLKLWQKMKRIPGLEYEADINGMGRDNIGDKAIFEFGMIKHGYAWIFPKRKHLSIGILTMGNNKSLMKSSLDKYISILGLASGTSMIKHGYFVPLRKAGCPLTNGRILITGDAAGLADPTLIEGIYNALFSGSIAAESILRFYGDSRSVINNYVNTVREKIINENRYSKCISKLVYNYPSLRTLLFKLNGKGLSETVTDIAMNRGKYSIAVKNPINYFRLFKPLILNNR